MNRPQQRPQYRKEKSPYDTKVIDIKRTAKVTGGGKKMSFQALVVAGDKHGRIGVGIGKGLDVPQSIEKATKKATASLRVIPTVKNTIPFDIRLKIKSATIILKPARDGQGIIAGGPIKIMCELAGIKNITTKLVSKTKNKILIVTTLMTAFDLASGNDSRNRFRAIDRLDRTASGVISRMSAISEAFIPSQALR